MASQNRTLRHRVGSWLAGGGAAGYRNGQAPALEDFRDRGGAIRHPYDLDVGPPDDGTPAPSFLTAPRPPSESSGAGSIEQEIANYLAEKRGIVAHPAGEFRPHRAVVQRTMERFARPAAATDDLTRDRLRLVAADHEAPPMDEEVPRARADRSAAEEGPLFADRGPDDGVAGARPGRRRARGGNKPKAVKLTPLGENVADGLENLVAQVRALVAVHQGDLQRIADLEAELKQRDAERDDLKARLEKIEAAIKV